MFNNNFLLRIGQADAFASAFEYVSNASDVFIMQLLSFEDYLSRPKHNNWTIGKGKYTDDCELSCAVCETLLRKEQFSKLSFADSFVRCFNHNRRKGYSKKFQELLESVDDGKELLKKIKPNSDKNGAAMRSVPLGFIKDIEELLEVAELQASITHSGNGIVASQMVSLISHYMIYDKGPVEKDYILSFCDEFVDGIDAFDEAWNGPVVGPNLGINTVHAALDVVTTEKSLIDMMTKIILFGEGSDSDSVAAITWGWASFRLNEELPWWFESHLEPGNLYGVDYLKNLGREVVNFYMKK